VIPGTAAPTRPADHDAEFAQGKAADHPFAVMYQGEYETPWDGTAVAVRAHARALASTGIPVFLKSFTGMVIDEHGLPQSVHVGGIPDVVRQEIGSLDKTTASAYCPIVKHLVVRDNEHLRRVVMPRGAVAKGGLEAEIQQRKYIYDSTIVYSVWERDRVDPGIAATLSRVAECWVPCEGNRQMLIRSGVPAEKVMVIPHPYDPTSPLLKLRQRRAETEWKKFYSIGRWEPRKGYAELIAAFLMAFKPTDKATLAIKYTGGNWPDYPTPDEALKRAVTSPEAWTNGWTEELALTRVHLVEGRFPRPQILKLHFKNNLYVCSSHGEAWCLPAFEAKLAGNALVYVPSGGVVDFADPDAGDSQVLPSRQCPVPRSYGWEADAQWTDYAVSDLAFALKRAQVPSSHDAGSIDRMPSLKSVGQQMRERILALTLSAEARDYFEQRTP
jgi:glycosyltransferase involved in cell wall biosynthesis